MATHRMSINSQLSERYNKGASVQWVNLRNFANDANLNRKPEYWIYVFNISQRAFQVRRPPSWPVINIGACEPGRPWRLVGKLPNVINEVFINGDGRSEVRGYQCERWVTDILNPSNLGMNIWDEATSWVDRGAEDLTRRGVFWTTNEEPNEAELRMSRAKMEKHYREVLANANDLIRYGRDKEINDEHHLAADYFMIRATWHTPLEAPETCPNCGEDIKRGVAFHANSAGVVCVIDWKRAVESGAKSRADVPSEKQWWKEKD